MWFAFIVGILIIIGSTLYAIFSDLGDAPDVFIGILISIAVTCCILFWSLLMGQGFEANEIYDTKTEYIIALKDNNTAKGEFFLGSGTVKSDSYYYYFTEDENHGKHFNKIQAEKVILYDDESKKPYIKTISKRSSSDIKNFFFIIDKVEYEIHIPKNSIDYSFSVDLE